MHLVHTAENFLQLQQLKQLLEENGIDCINKGESSIGSGAAAGEIPPALMKNTLHVFEDKDVARAKTLIADYLSYAGLEEDWICNNCKESVDKEFMQCWNCGADYKN